MEYELHDYIYEIFYKHITDNGLAINKDIPNPQVGKFINITANYDFVDMQFFIDILSNTFIQKSVHGKNSSLNCNNIVEIVKSSALFLPTNSFISVGKYLIPLKDKFLRESSKEIRFKYSGKINLIGKISSEFVKEQEGLPQNPNILQITRALNLFASDVLHKMGFIETRFIVSPVALYF